MQTATVIKCEGELALVSTAPNKSPCDTCKSPCAQRSCENVKPVKLWAKNEAGAHVGDTVEVTPANSAGTVGTVLTLLCMCVPLAAGIIAYALTVKHTGEAVSFAAFLGVFIALEAILLPLAKHLEKKAPTLIIIKNLENW